MQPLSKEQFNKLSSEQKREHAHYWASLNYKLKEYELKYLKGKGREEYLDEKVNSGTWLEDYEFHALDKEGKKAYIVRKKFLADDEVNRMGPEMQRFYVNNLTSNKLSMSDEAFMGLSSDKIRNLYVVGKMKNSNPINLKGMEIKVLNKSQQKEYVDYFLKLDTIRIRPEYIELLHPSVKDYYINKYNKLNESKKTGGSSKDIVCKNCGWEWDIEKGDDNPYLCHNCGYDNKKNKFDHKALKDWKESNKYRPYKEKELSENLFERTFSKNTNSSELTWHRDREDRIVVALNENDWKLQMDNELPVKMTPGKPISIKRNEFHRILKGSGDLKIAVYKKNFDE